MLASILAAGYGVYGRQLLILKTENFWPIQWQGEKDMVVCQLKPSGAQGPFPCRTSSYPVVSTLQQAGQVLKGF